MWDRRDRPIRLYHPSTSGMDFIFCGPDSNQISVGAAHSSLLWSSPSSPMRYHLQCFFSDILLWVSSIHMFKPSQFITFLYPSVMFSILSLSDVSIPHDLLGRIHTDNFTRRAYRSRTVHVGLPVYPLRRVRPVHADHISMCSQWTRTVRVGLALQCECSSGRVGRVG